MVALWAGNSLDFPKLSLLGGDGGVSLRETMAAAAMNCSLRVKRLLLDAKFEGYKLSLEPLACYQVGLDSREWRGGRAGGSFTRTAGLGRWDKGRPAPRCWPRPLPWSRSCKTQRAKSISPQGGERSGRVPRAASLFLEQDQARRDASLT